MEPDLTPADDSRSRIVLASGSRYRARVLTDAGYDVEIDPPRVDERILDPLFHSEGPQHLATELARLKVLDVAPRHPGATVLAGDQVGVLTAGDRQVLLSKTPDARSAVRQLMAMSGTVHRLVNAIVVMRGPAGPSVSGVDEATVTMRPFSEAEALRYVERFEPFDTAGSYRLEDAESMEPGESLVASVEVEHPSGVLGMPLPLFGRLLAELGQPSSSTSPSTSS